MFSWLWIKFTDLPWWAMVFWGIYFLYTLQRAYEIWTATTELGLWKGYRFAFFNKKEIRLYHLVRIVVDLPAAIVGLFFPVIRKVFSLKLYEFKDEKKVQ